MVSSVNAQESSKIIRRVTWWGTGTNITLSLLKLVCGLVIGSQTMIADGIHSFSDLISDAALLIGVHFWSAPPDADHPYGHARIETLATTFIGVLLVIVAIMLGYRAISSLLAPHENLVTGPIAIAIMIFSIVSKELLYRWTTYHAKKIHSSALHANAWHHRSDALSSIPALIAIVISSFKPEWWFIDAIGAIVVSCMLIVVGGSIALKALSELSDSCSKETIEALTQLALRIPGVEDAHALRARHFGSGLIVDLHIEVDPEMPVKTAHEISEIVQNELVRQGPNVIEVIVHIEPRGEG